MTTNTTTAKPEKTNDEHVHGPDCDHDHDHADEPEHVHGPDCNHGHHHHHAAPRPFVREVPKIGRNDPCLCGSEQKFKKCCGKGL